MGLCWKSINPYVWVRQTFIYLFVSKIMCRTCRAHPQVSILEFLLQSKKKSIAILKGIIKFPIFVGVFHYLLGELILPVAWLCNIWVSQYLTYLHATSSMWDIPHLFKQTHECYLHCLVEIYQHTCSYMFNYMLIWK